jgi:Outer membrane protein beta-barrel domain
MKKMTSLSILALGLVLLSAFGATDALAQRGGGGLAGPIEFSATYGSMWGGNISTYNGKLRTATGPSYGFALDIPVQKAMAVELSYTRQDGAIDYDTRNGKTKLTDMSVNYWHIGAVRGLTEGKIRPFVTTSLGATYYSPSASSVNIEGEDFRVDSVTKFSFAIGAGFKAYFGKAEKIGIRASIKTLPTLYNTGGGVWFGTGGASVGVTGNAIWQWEAAAGLTVKFGG